MTHVGTYVDRCEEGRGEERRGEEFGYRNPADDGDRSVQSGQSVRGVWKSKLMLAEMGQVRDMRARDAGKRGKCEVRRDARSERMECGVAAGWRELVVEG